MPPDLPERLSRPVSSIVSEDCCGSISAGSSRQLLAVFTCRDRQKSTRSCRPILLKKSERIDSAYTEIEKRPIYALQAFLAGQADCSESLQPYHLCLSR